MGDTNILESISGFCDVPIIAWAISLRIMLNRQRYNRGKVDPRKSRGRIRDMRCDLVGVFSEVLIMLHLMKNNATGIAIDHAQSNLLHTDIRSRPNGEADFLLLNEGKQHWVDSKSYSIMRPHQRDTIKVNAQKNIKLKSFGCDHIILCVTRPFSQKAYVTGLIPLESISNDCGWKYVSKEQSFNDYYSITPGAFLKYGADIVRDLYYEPQHSIDQVETLALNSREFDEYMSDNFPMIRW